jgi:hypothetical protein
MASAKQVGLPNFEAEEVELVQPSLRVEEVATPSEEEGKPREEVVQGPPWSSVEGVVMPWEVVGPSTSVEEVVMRSVQPSEAEEPSTSEVEVEKPSAEEGWPWAWWRQGDSAWVGRPSVQEPWWGSEREEKPSGEAEI